MEVTPPGQGGFVSPSGERSVHFEDQLDMYQNFGKKRMWFYDEDVDANKVSDTVVSYSR